jgi:transposase
LRIGWTRVRMSGMGIYSKDIRIRALAAVDRGIPRREEVVQIFSVSLTTLKRWLKMRREGKDLSPGVSTGRRRRILATLEEKRLLWGQLEENDDATLRRHCELWEEKTGVRVSISAMSRAIRGKLGWTYKKRRWRPPSETRKREVLSASA